MQSKTILILASNPRADLDLGYEIHALKKIIEERENLQEFDVIIDDAISPSNIQRLFLEHEPRIVHFCGHGSGVNGLVFVDYSGQEQLVSTQALSNLFKEFGDTIECVLLNACYSEFQAEEIAKHINYAIGMNQAIADDAAIFFAKGFYQALGKGKQIRQCFRLGKNAIELELSKLSGQTRKFEVLDEECELIPEHLKPIIEIKLDLTLFPEDIARQKYIQANQEDFNLGKREQPALSKQEYRFRKILLNKVKDSWIKGVLENSLHTKALLELKIQNRPNLVNNPFSDYQELPVDPNSSYEWLNATDIFEQMGDGRTLLILGEPGSGKTIALLRLAKRFIEKAEQNLSLPIPVVFNLSSWCKKKQPIAEWVTIELKEKYQVSKALAKQWIEKEQLLPLFDGLDEVNKNHRNDCVKAINDFLYSYGSTETVVCSRFQDYQVLSEKLQLRSAIYLQSLTAEHIDWYLKDTGNKLVGLKTLLKNDPEIEEFAKTPLILSIMSLTYQDYSSEDVLQHLGLSANRHQNLFDNYIERVSLRPNKTCKKYDLDTSKKWLNFIAKNIIKDKRAIFYPEKIQPSWLSNNSQTKIYLIITSLVVGILYFLLGGIIFGISVGITTSNWNLFLKTGVDYGVAIGVGSALSIGLPNRIISSLVFGLCFALHSMIFIQDSNLITAGIIGSSIVVIAWVTRGSFFEINKINSTSLLRCDSKKFKSSFISGFISGLYFSIFIGIITGLGFDINKINSYQLGDLIFILSLVLLCIVITFIYSYIKKLNLIEILIIISGIVTIFMIAAIEWNLELVQSLLIGAFIGLLIGLFLVGIIFGLINGITAGITNEKIEEEKFLTTRTWIDRNRVFYRITSILILWLTVLLILPTNFPDINISVSFYGVFWLVSYLLRNGAFTYIQNLVVRAVLGNRYVPLNYTEFLDYAVDRIFMYKSGRGYLFIHRMLMEHFANMELDK